jgi:GxxExxY protein
MLVEEELTQEVIGAAMEVHRHLGPGLLESTYEGCLCHELSLRGIAYQRQVDLPVSYKGAVIDCGYRPDVIVEDKILLELKAVDELHPIHEAQLLTYLRVTGIRVGFLINFNIKVLKNGITRRVL